jgi:hypothetical protein
MFVLAGLSCFVGLLIILAFCIIVGNDEDGSDSDDDTSVVGAAIHLPYSLALYSWIIGQSCTRLLPKVSTMLTQNAWKSFETLRHQQQVVASANNHNHNDSKSNILLLDVQTLHVKDFITHDFVQNNNYKYKKDPIKYLQITYGIDWRDRPLLLKGLWNIIPRNSSSTATRYENKDKNQKQRSHNYSLLVDGLLQMII